MHDFQIRRPAAPAVARRRHRPLSTAAAIALVMVTTMLAAAACSGSAGADATAAARDSAAAAAAEAATAPGDAPRAPIKATGYAPGPVDAAAGSVRGTVSLDGDAPADSVVRPTSDQEVCGDSLFVRTVEHDGAHLAGVVVWLEGVRRGKRLPLERRFDLSIDGCQMTPRAQAVLAGGTLNVHNSDPIVHRARFTRQGTRDPVATASYSDEGQVVPVSSALAKAGLVEVRCDVHPWTRAWVAVFDHPYFATTERDGAFAFDSVPPGAYTLVAWHPRLGVVRQKVTVTAGGATEAAVVMKSK